MLKRTIYRLLFFLLPLPFFAVCIAMIAAKGIFGVIDPENIDRQTFVRIVQLRDFRRFPPDLTESLTHWAEQEFGRRSPRRPQFELPVWEKKISAYFRAHRSERQSRTETNLTAMAKIRFFQWIHEYQVSTLAQKASLMNDVVADMRYWQEVYLDYLRCLNFPEPTLAELYQEFVRMIENFKVDASPEEVVCIDSFTRDMNKALFASEVQRSIKNFLSPPE